MKNIQAIRGMNDILPKDIAFWQNIEQTLKDILLNYGYNEIRLPIVEHTSLFQKSIGEMTDVVEKEMYSFFDRNGDSLTMRPEGTTSCVRAGIEHGLLYNQEQRLWYIGPMFRHERPQKGRYRQFYQLGVEVFGQNGPEIDAELIFLTFRWWRALGINKHVSLKINSIGSLETRSQYCEALLAFLYKHKSHLDEDSLRRMQINPMRILDTKNPDIQELLNDAPIIIDYLDKDSQKHFSNLCRILNLSDISYTINPRLVRGLNYYNRTVFEWVSADLGSQDAICGGGRYDNLVEHLGGHKIPAIGFATGLERLVFLIKKYNHESIFTSCTDVYLITVDNLMQHETLLLAEQLRNALPSMKLTINYNNSSVKKQIRRANKINARVLLILKNDKNIENQLLLKDLVTGNEEILAKSDVIKRISLILNY